MCWTRSSDSRVEEHVLLLDAERVRIARAEAMVEDARLEGWGQPARASTSISSSQRGSTSEWMVTVVFTGRMSRKISPCAFATPAKSASGVTKIRVRTTCSKPTPTSRERLADDLEAAPRLPVGVGGRVGVVGHDRRGARDPHEVSRAHGAAVAHVGSYVAPDETRWRSTPA